MWPAILDRATHEQLKRYFDDQARRVGPRRRTTFSGIFRCGLCGSKLASDSTGGKRIWRCKPSPGRPHCGRIGITAEPFEESVKTLLFETVDQGNLPAAQVEVTDENAAITSELGDIEQRFDGLANDYVDGLITRSQSTPSPSGWRLDGSPSRTGSPTPGAVSVLTPYLGTPGALGDKWDDATTPDDERNMLLHAAFLSITVAKAWPGASAEDRIAEGIAWRR